MNMEALGYGLSKDLVRTQRQHNAIVSATLDILIHYPIIRLRVSDFMRSILKQARECFAGTDQAGAFYVLYEMGVYFLHPCGGSAKYRHSYSCRIDFELGQWIFEVLP